MTIRLWLDVNADVVQMLWCTHGVDDGRAAVAGPDVGETLVPRGTVVAAPAAAERIPGRHAVRTLVINLARLDRNLRHLQHATTKAFNEVAFGRVLCKETVNFSTRSRFVLFLFETAKL